MTTINVRYDSQTNDEIKIVFGLFGESLVQCNEGSLYICDKQNEEYESCGKIEILHSDIDYLIKALQKAKEVFTDD